MLFAFDSGQLEIRDGGGGSRRLRGRFPYNKVAVLSDGGRNGGKPQKEKFAPGAFAYSLDNTDISPIHLLVGHSYDKPLASTDNDTLQLTDSPDALTFDAIITAAIADTTYGADILKMILAGLAVGISPGFRIPPPRAVPADQAEQITHEPHDPSKGMHGAIIRTILAALLFELSIVTRPAYDDTQIEARNWQVENGIAVPRKIERWRR